MARIALHFEGDNTPMILDSDMHPPDFVWKVGRTDDNEIWLRHPMVSRNHGRIRYNEEDGEWEVRDTRSKNGIFINYQRIKPGTWVALQDEQTIYFGVPLASVTISFVIDETLGSWMAGDCPTANLN